MARGLSATLLWCLLAGCVQDKASNPNQDLSAAVDMSGVDLSGVDFSGVDFSGVDFSGVDLSGVDLSGVDLSGVDLSGVDFSGVDFSGPCPGVLGKYSVSASGPGCGNLNVNAPECIAGLAGSCVAQFTSGPEATLGAVRGTATLMMDGSFTNGDLQLGTVDRNDCSGSWNASTSTLVLNCGAGTGQECVVTLSRVATSCP